MKSLKELCQRQSLLDETRMTDPEQSKTTSPQQQTREEAKMMSEKDEDQQLSVRSTGLFDSIVVVLVGPVKHRFDIHKGLLCESSGRFQASLLGPPKEARGKIVLPEHDPTTFAFFQYWLYREKLRGFHDIEFNKPTIKYLRSVAQKEANPGKPGKSKKKSLHSLGHEHQDLRAYSLANYKDVPFTALIDLYVLADSLQAPRLKDSIISMLVEVYDYYIPPTYKDPGVTLLFWTHDIAVRPAELEGPATGINRAWEALPRESHLKKLLVLLFCNSVDDLDSGPEDEELHPGFVRAIAQKYASRWCKAKESTKWGAWGVICEFHEHGYEEECVLPGEDFAEEDGTKVGW